VLAYAEWGDPEGWPLVFLHGVPGSRLWLDEDVTRSYRVRLITVDRPGYGNSSLHPDGSLLSFADDVGHLADGLGLERFGVASWSMGGPFALACGARLADRLTRVGLLSISHTPIEEEPGGFEALTLEDRDDVDLARKEPARLVARWREEDGWREYQRDPTAMFASLGDVDAWVLKDVATRKALEAHIREGLRPGPDGMLWEEVMVIRPWGFRLEDVATEVRLWHGDRDVVPLDRAEFVAQSVPDGHLVIWADEGHCGFIRRWDQVLEDMLEGLR
jgi:pimeloyl-ACP methyl ester carboxylesterase